MGSTNLDAASSDVANTLSATADLLDEALEALSGFSTETKDDRPQLYRSESAIESGRALVGIADPAITPQNFADEVRTTAEALRNQLQQAVADGGGDIGSASEALLSSLMRLRQPNAMLEEKARDAAARYRRSLAPRIRGVKGEIKRMEGELGEVKESTSTEVAAIAERLDALKGEIDASATRVDDLISDQDTKFTEAQEERRKEFADALKEAQGSLSGAQQEIEDRKIQAFGRLTEIEEEVASTAAALGGRATAIGHGAESIEQASRAFRWSVATIALLLAAAVIPVWLGVLHAKQSPESVAGKITVALIIAGVAGYAARIARHHRERGATARRLELEMNSFGPFVAPLEATDRNDLRSTIIWRFFGPEAVPQEPDSDPRPGSRLGELLHRRKRGEDRPPEPPA